MQHSNCQLNVKNIDQSITNLNTGLMKFGLQTLAYISK